MNILTVTRWVAQAWKHVKEETIRKCFKKAGVLDDELNVVTRGVDSQDSEPFLDVDASTQLQELMIKVLPSEDICSINEYISGEGSLSVFLGMDDTDWEKTFLTSLSAQSSATGDGELVGQDDDNKDDIEDDLYSSSEVKIAREVIQMLEGVQQFLWNQSCTHQATQVGSIIDSVAILHSSSVVQTTLHDYIS